MTVVMCFSMIAVLMSSCAETTYLSNGYGTYCDTKVNSYGNYDFKGKTFYIESGDESISSNDLEFKEYAWYLAEVFRICGAIETDDKDNADLCVLFNYSITDKSYTENIPIPEFGRTSIASTTTKGSTTTYNYNYGTTGYHYVQNNVDNYVRVINVYGFDNKRRDVEPIMLWKSNLVSEGSSDNLRNVIPYMLSIAKGGKVFGKNSNKVNENNYPYREYKDDYIFTCFKKGLLSNPNLMMSPKFNRIKLINNLSIEYVEKRETETIICVHKWGCLTYSISPELYIVYNGKQTRVEYAEDYNLGSIIYDECGFRYFVLHFPVNIDDTDSFELREYTNKKHIKYNSWGTVELKK